MANETETTLQKYYNGKSVFITGGSGFMGKVINRNIFNIGDVIN